MTKNCLFSDYNDSMINDVDIAAIVSLLLKMDGAGNLKVQIADLLGSYRHSNFDFEDYDPSRTEKSNGLNMLRWLEGKKVA